MNGLIAVMQAAPLGRQEVRDHDRLAIAFRLWHWLTGQLGPHDVAEVVLVKRGLIMCDEDKAEWAVIGKREPIRAWEFVSIIVPLVEAEIISFPSLNKRMSISHNILPFMAINVHPVSGFLVPPVKSLEPAGGSPL
jgi:hypothetical protein